MKESEISDDDIVKVDLRIGPCEVEMCQVVTDGHVWNESCVYQLTLGVNATGKPTTEQVDSHDTEDEPEDKADEKNVEDRRNRLD